MEPVLARGHRKKGKKNVRRGRVAVAPEAAHSETDPCLKREKLLFNAPKQNPTVKIRSKKKG